MFSRLFAPSKWDKFQRTTIIEKSSHQYHAIINIIMNIIIVKHLNFRKFQKDNSLTLCNIISLFISKRLGLQKMFLQNASKFARIHKMRKLIFRFYFLYYVNSGKFEAYCWNILLCLNLLFLKSDIVFENYQENQCNICISDEEFMCNNNMT